MEQLLLQFKRKKNVEFDEQYIVLAGSAWVAAFNPVSTQLNNTVHSTQSMIRVCPQLFQ